MLKTSRNESITNNIIVVGLSEDITITSETSYTSKMISLNNVLFRQGTKLNLKNGQISIGKDVKYVKVSCNLTAKGSTNIFGARIRKNSTVIAMANTVPSSNSEISLSISPMAINVSEGDLIDLCIYFVNSNSQKTICHGNNTYTQLMIEVID